MEKVRTPLKKIEGFDKWEVDGWLETLIRASEIRADPKKMKAVRACAKLKLEAMQDAVKKVSE